MKLIFSAAILGWSSISMAVNFESLNTCLAGLGHKSSAVGTDFSILPKADYTKDGGSVLVVSRAGAKEVKVKQVGGQKVAVFEVPGGKEQIYQAINSSSDGTFARGWTENYGSNRPFKEENVTAIPSNDEAETLAGAAALKVAQEKEPKTAATLVAIEQLIRSDSIASTSSRPTAKIVNPDKLAAEFVPVEKALENLKACDRVPNQNIKQAAALDKKRLGAIKEKLEALKVEATKLAECLKTSGATAGQSSTTR